jgi:hypothetical protein
MVTSSMMSIRGGSPSTSRSIGGPVGERSGLLATFYQ